MLQHTFILVQVIISFFFFFFSSRRRHTRCLSDWSSDVCSSDLPALRAAYFRATEKTKNKLEYEEALWALADRAETRRQVASIYRASYLRIMQSRRGRQALSQSTFNHRLLTLRSDAHGKIVNGHGSGYFSFRENVMRGFVRLKAETEGVELIPDV